MQNLAAPVGNAEDAAHPDGDPAGGPAAVAGGVRAAGRRAAAAGRWSTSATWRRATTGPRRRRTAAMYNGAPSVGVDVVKSRGFSTTAVAADGAGQVDEVQKTLPDGRPPGGGAQLGRAGRALGDRRGAYPLRGRPAHRAGRLPLPQLLAQHGDHRARAARLGAGLLRRRLRGRLHPQHHVAARPLAGHRHPHRRRHRGAREHRAPRGDGKGPLHRRARGHRRDRPRRRRHHLLHRRRLRPVGFMGGMAGQWFQPFALTIAFSVLVSLFVSFSLDPMLSAYWSDPPRAEHEKRWITRDARPLQRTGSTRRRAATSAWSAGRSTTGPTWWCWPRRR